MKMKMKMKKRRKLERRESAIVVRAFSYVTSKCYLIINTI